MGKNKPKKAGKVNASKSKGKSATSSKSKDKKKPQAKVVKKDKKPAKKAKEKVIKNKNVKTVAKVTKVTIKDKGKPVAQAKSKAVAPATNNGKSAAKPAVKPEVKTPAVPVAKVPAVKGPKVKVRPVLTPEQMALPKLPANIHLKKQKGKLAPGEKRVVKTEVITHHVIIDKPIDPEKKLKAEPKGKYQLEYIVRCPVTLLYDFLSTPSGLQEWFADDVHLKDDTYTFNWDGQLQQAKLLNAKIDNYLRFRWVDKPEGTYVEFRVTQDELTNEVSLVVTDFGDSEDDIVTNKRLWDSQIHRLIKVMGAY